MKHGSGLLALLCWVVFMQPWPVHTAQRETLDRILAVVSGHVIMLSDVRGFELLGLGDRKTTTGGRSMLDHLIERRLMLEEVDRYLVDEPVAEEVDQTVARVRERFDNETAYQLALATAGFTDSDLRQVVRDNERIRLYLDQRFASAGIPSERDIEAYYREHASEFSPSGVPPSLDQLREIIRQRVSEERRARLIDDWVAGLARRSEIFRVDGGF